MKLKFRKIYLETQFYKGEINNDEEFFYALLKMGLKGLQLSDIFNNLTRDRDFETGDDFTVAMKERLKAIKDEKNEVVKSQDYEKAAKLREDEKSVLNILEEQERPTFSFHEKTNPQTLLEYLTDGTHND